MTANLLKTYSAAQASIVTVRGLVQTRQKLLKTQVVWIDTDNNTDNNRCIYMCTVWLGNEIRDC